MPEPAVPRAFDDHFRNPRNTGVLDGADGHIEVENPVCGDLLYLYYKLSSERLIEQVRFQVYGCPAAIAAGSVLTEMLTGAGLADVRALEATAISKALGGLEQESFHGAVLAADAAQALVREVTG